MSDPFQFSGFPRRLAAASGGFWYLLRTCANSRIHLLATAVVVGLGIWLRLSRAEWLWIIIAIALVWSIEAINSAVETLADRISGEHDEQIGRAKDLAAAAVLVAAIAAAAIGLLVFIPRLITI